jgi:hypothetical protein
MWRGLKINTSIVICATFVFRLLFVNIGLISSLNSHQNNATIKSHFSSVLKRRKIDTIDVSSSKEKSVIEICEEDLDDDDDQTKTNPFFFIQFLYSFLADKTVSLKSNNFFDFVSCKLSSRKYLSISVLRI